MPRWKSPLAVSTAMPPPPPASMSQWYQQQLAQRQAAQWQLAQYQQQLQQQQSNVPLGTFGTGGAGGVGGHVYMSGASIGMGWTEVKTPDKKEEDMDTLTKLLESKV